MPSSRPRRSGVPFRGLFLTADLATRRARVGRARGDASDADVAVVERQERYELGASRTWLRSMPPARPNRRWAAPDGCSGAGRMIDRRQMSPCP